MGMIGFLHSTPSPKLTPQVHYGALRAGDKRQDQARALHPLGLVGKKNTGRTGGCVASGGGGRQLVQRLRQGIHIRALLQVPARPPLACPTPTKRHPHSPTARSHGASTGVSAAARFWGLQMGTRAGLSSTLPQEVNR